MHLRHHQNSNKLIPLRFLNIKKVWSFSERLFEQASVFELQLVPILHLNQEGEFLNSGGCSKGEK
jgi:hypothetical protein